MIATKKFCFVLKIRKRFIFPFFLIFLSFFHFPYCSPLLLLELYIIFSVKKRENSNGFFCFFSQITVVFNLFYSCCVRPTHRSPSFYIMRIIASKDNYLSMHRLHRREGKGKNAGADECSKGSVENMDASQAAHKSVHARCARPSLRTGMKKADLRYAEISFRAEKMRYCFIKCVEIERLNISFWMVFTKPEKSGILYFTYRIELKTT